MAFSFPLLLCSLQCFILTVVYADYYEWKLMVPAEDEKYQAAGIKQRGSYRSLPFVRYHTTCARICYTDQRCKSFNFHQRRHLCELNGGDHVSHEENFIAESGWQYYGRNWLKIDFDALGPCAKKSCGEGEICLELCDRDGFSVAECSCLQDKKQLPSCRRREPGRWTSWGDWTACSRTCGLGLKFRERNCTHPYIEGLEITPDNCPGSLNTDVEVCDGGPCPAWKPWGEWSECSTHFSCGEGNRMRNRTCEGGEANVDDLCTGQTVEDEPCFAQDCNAPLRIVGSETYGEGRVEIYNDLEDSWGGICADNWNEKAATIACKQALNLDRASEATSGNKFGQMLFPLNLRELDCKGDENTLQNCTHRGWMPKDSTCLEGAAGARCVVDGVWSEWTPFGDCSVSCDWGFRERTRECNAPSTLNGGKDCDGMPRERKKCYLRICPIDGVWMSWSSWGECSLTCGSGLRYRNRTCDGPYYEGKPCPTDPEGEIGIEACNTQRCPFRNCHEYKIVDGTNYTGVYLLDPDGPGELTAFYTHCNMDDPEVGITNLTHQDLARTHVTGFESRAEYTLEMVYANATLEHAIALVDSSTDCKTFVKWECQSAAIHEPDHTYVENKTLTLTFVTDRNKQELDYFPGGVPGTYGCDCNRNKTCIDPKRWCNCDANLQDHMAEDSGYVDILNQLPITGFYAGDTGARWEEGYHTIGPLLCTGTPRGLVAGQTHPMETLYPTSPPIFGP